MKTLLASLRCPPPRFLSHGSGGVQKGLLTDPISPLKFI